MPLIWNYILMSFIKQWFQCISMEPQRRVLPKMATAFTHSWLIVSHRSQTKNNQLFCVILDYDLKNFVGLWKCFKRQYNIYTLYVWKEEGRAFKTNKKTLKISLNCVIKFHDTFMCEGSTKTDFKGVVER